MALSEGQIIGSYRVTSLLGQGGMATVYKAFHPKLNRYVALKMMHQSFLSDPQFIARFEREAQIIARLEHTNIVPVYDFAEHDGQPYIVMKYVEGISLKEALADGPLELRDAMTILASVAAALDYAHSQHVLHRDIKPSNIMLDKGATPYLTDFGLARTVQDGESSLSQGMLIGTPAYMSPEQASGLTDLDSRSDLYSLGVVLYELIVGKAPFGGGTTYKILNDHLTAPPPVPSSLNGEVPPAVEVVLLKALAKEPNERYQTALEMYKALRGALVESQIRQLNPGERHSIVVSLSKPRAESNLPMRVDFGNTPVKPSGSSARSSVPIPGQVVNRREPAKALPPPKSSGHPGVWLLGGAALMLAIIVVVGLVMLNMRNGQGEPTLAAEALPTLMVTDAPTVEPTRIPPTDAPPIVMTQIPNANPPDQPNGGGQNPPPDQPGGGQNPPPGDEGQNAPPDQPSGSPPDSAPPNDPLMSDLPAFPAEYAPYTVETLSLEQAEAAVQQNPNDPEAYLALAQAQIIGRQPPPTIGQTLRQGATVADINRYAVTLVEMFQDSPVPPEVLFLGYNEIMAAVKDPVLYSVARERAGARLYTLALRTDAVPVFVLGVLDNFVDSSYDALFPAILARMYVTAGKLDAAEAALNRAGTDSPEAELIYGDLLHARGDSTGARQHWEQAAQDERASAWVRAQAQANLEQNP